MTPSKDLEVAYALGRRGLGWTREMMPNHCVLVLRNSGKGIPYFGGAQEGWNTNHGFVSLKGRPEDEALAIPEVSDNDALKRFVVRMNRPETSFFTVGCEKSFNHGDGGFWGKGFVEFAINSRQRAADAQHYFKLFFQFNQVLWKSQFTLPVQFAWELEGASFDVSGTSGFTAAVWIQTAQLKSEDESTSIWSRALDVLTDFLCSVQCLSGQAIY